MKVLDAPIVDLKSTLNLRVKPSFVPKWTADRRSLYRKRLKEWRKVAQDQGFPEEIDGMWSVT
jgi:hypothetical protein